MLLHTITAIGAAVAVAMLMSGCGTNDTPETAQEPPSTSLAPEPTGTNTAPPAGSGPDAPASPEPQDPNVEVTISGDTVEAPGNRIKANAGEPVTFTVTSDRPGEFHVHSSPEQTPGFVAGRSIVQVTVERPGLIEVEEHESGELIVQLEVH
ncbi:hypothetical protein ASG90_17180 [Nocardioides sp. Soil797]|nr:hypothetical protein ASG90_17180 [Nocardioides sp. Soil797]